MAANDLESAPPPSLELDCTAKPNYDHMASLDSDDTRVSVVVVDNDFDFQIDRSSLNDTEKVPLSAWESCHPEPDDEMDLPPRPTTRWHKVVSSLRGFVRLRFPDPEMEHEYQLEDWNMFKPLAVLCSLFLVLFYVLTIVFVHRTKFVYYTYVGICGLCTLPVPLLVGFDVRRRVPWLYQVWIGAAAWCWGVVVPTEMYLCHFFGKENHCTNRQFLFFMATLVMHPTLALTLLRQDRVVHVVIATGWTVFGSTIYMIQPQTPLSFIRNLSILEAYNIFLPVTAYYRERTARQLFCLRMELKEQYRAVQAAQILERKANDSKRQFVSYIFHEVRVPLNTATLATQNLEGEGVFASDRLSTGHRDMIDGLIGSLDMMEKVLNDVLSFGRMEAGNLEQARKPFAFHKAINIVALLHRVHAAHANLDFDVELDPQIDEVGGLVVGDEMRLRQVTSNLISNALKFTRTGGVTVRTKLVCAKDNDSNLHPYPSDSRMVAIRVEVSDTGCGLRPADVENNRLFSPYVQTEIGRRQGGKGSGLGLALVYQIVQLSGGRLGVESTEGKGSTFWFEIPYSLLPPRSRLPSTGSALRTSGEFRHPSSASHLRPSHEFRRVSVSSRLHGHGTSWSPSPSPKSTAHEFGPPAHSPVSPCRTLRTLPEDRPEPKAGHDQVQLSALVVDDDALTRRLMGRMLGRLGHRVQYADNGGSAVDMIRAAADGSAPPLDIVFLDNQMPVMTGVEVARTVRAMGCAVRIVGCTGNALEEDQIEYLDAGADGVCPKPVRQADIQAQLALVR